MTVYTLGLCGALLYKSAHSCVYLAPTTTPHVPLITVFAYVTLRLLEHYSTIFIKRTML